MKARNKKGPSWANDDETQPVASTSTLPPPRPKTQSAAEPKDSEDDPEESEESPANNVSDMDWFKRHQTTQVDIPEPAKVTVFDQSGEEDVEMTGDGPPEVSVCTSIVFT